MDNFEIRKLWAGRVAEYRESGLSMKAWSEKSGHSLERLRHWSARFSQQSESSWLPVSVTEAGSFSDAPSPSPLPLTLQIQMENVRINVYTGAPPEMLRDVLSALVKPC